MPDGQGLKLAALVARMIGAILLPSAQAATVHPATHAPDPLQRMAAEIVLAGRIDDPVQVANILHDTVGVDLVRVHDFFGRTDVAAGQTRYALDDRAPMAEQGLEVALVIRNPDEKPDLDTRLPQSGVLGAIKAELDINDWGVVSQRPWRSVARQLGASYSSVVLPDTPGLPSFELPAAPCCRLIMTVSPHGSELLPVWFVHITEYGVRQKN